MSEIVFATVLLRRTRLRARTGARARTRTRTISAARSLVLVSRLVTVAVSVALLAAAARAASAARRTFAPAAFTHAVRLTLQNTTENERQARHGKKSKNRAGTANESENKCSHKENARNVKIRHDYRKNQRENNKIGAAHYAAPNYEEMRRITARRHSTVSKTESERNENQADAKTSYCFAVVDTALQQHTLSLQRNQKL